MCNFNFLLVGLPLLQSNRRCLWMSEMSPLDEKETPVKQALTEQTSINVIYWFMCCSELWWLVCGLPHMQTSKPADWGSRLQLKQLKKKKRSQMERGRRQTEMIMSKVKSGPVLSVKQMAVIIYRGREREKNKIKHQKVSSFMSQSECVVNT